MRLTELGHAYGDFPAHDGLWHMARETAHDVLVRMALVPRVLEARGLDVTPAMIVRLHQAGDAKSAAVLETILRDEIGHVQAGTRWFHYVCRQRALDPLETFRSLLAEYAPGRIRTPFNIAARQQAGFGSDEMALLEDLARLDAMTLARHRSQVGLISRSRHPCGVHSSRLPCRYQSPSTIRRAGLPAISNSCIPGRWVCPWIRC